MASSWSFTCVKPGNIWKLRRYVERYEGTKTWYIKVLFDGVHEFKIMQRLKELALPSSQINNGIWLTPSVCIPAFSLIEDTSMLCTLPGEGEQFSVILDEYPPIKRLASSCRLLVTTSLVENGFTLMDSFRLSQTDFTVLLKILREFYMMCRITHTDLKPDNILIHRSQQGQLRVCLIDFELSIRDKSKDDYNTYLINKCWMLKQSYASELISAQRFEFAMCFDFLRLLSACHWSYQEIHTLPSEVNTILLYKQSTIQYDYGKLLTQAWYEKFLSNIQDVLGVV